MNRSVSRQRIQEIGKEAVKEILDVGLEKSTFKDLYSAAHTELKKYRSDMEVSVEGAIRKVLKIGDV